MAVQFNRFPTAEQAEQALRNELLRHISEGPGYTESEDSRTLGTRRATAPYVIMLPGGSTPLRIYNTLTDTPPAEVHPALHFVLSDDRYVSEESSDSNYHHIKPMAEALRLPDSRVIHPDTTLSLEDAAADYGDALQDLDRQKAFFALAILGIGTDGHTASIFPGSPNDSSAWSTPVYEKAGFDRITTGEAFISRFRRLLFFATGEGKWDILYEISRRPEEYPAGRLMLSHAAAEIWTDQGYHDE